jgi:hypothetical protein
VSIKSGDRPAVAGRIIAESIELRRICKSGKEICQRRFSHLVSRARSSKDSESLAHLEMVPLRSSILKQNVQAMFYSEAPYLRHFGGSKATMPEIWQAALAA